MSLMFGISLIYALTLMHYGKPNLPGSARLRNIMRAKPAIVSAALKYDVESQSRVGFISGPVFQPFLFQHWGEGWCSKQTVATANDELTVCAVWQTKIVVAVRQWGGLTNVRGGWALWTTSD